jgi:hypothetical protein
MNREYPEAQLNFARGKSNYLILSIADMFFISLFFGISFLMGKRLLADGDTGYHIRAGEIILDTLSVPKYDIFSFLSPPLPWTAQEWLSEVIMALLHRTFGLTGVVIFFAFLISAVYYLMFRILRTRNGNILAVVFTVLIVAASSQVHWLARPHIFSFLLMVIWYYLLDLYQYKDKNYLYCLAPLMLLWVNLHAGFMLGFILLGVYFLGNIIRIIFPERNGIGARKQKARTLGLVMSLCAIVALLNPNGYHILIYPFNLTSSTFLFLFLLAVITISRKPLNIIEIFLVLLFTYMSLYSVRYIPLFCIAVAPILLKQINAILQNGTGRFMAFLARADNIARTDESARGYLWPAIAILVVAIFVAKGLMVYEFDREKKPVKAVEFLKKEHLSGNMFNNDEFGDYIIYSAYPQYKVFIDGRLDMYGPERLKEYIDVTFAKHEWEKTLEKYEIKWIIFNADSIFCTFLLTNNDWRLIYADKVANIFVKNIPENQYLINKYGHLKPLIAKN